MKLRDLLPPRRGRTLRGELVEVLASAPPSTSSPRPKSVDMANGKEATATEPNERETAPESDNAEPGHFDALWRSVVDDLAESRAWRGRTPSLEEHTSEDPCSGIPPEYRALRAGRLAYHWTLGIALVALGAGLAFVGARPGRFVLAAGLVVLAIVTF